MDETIVATSTFTDRAIAAYRQQQEERRAEEERRRREKEESRRSAALRVARSVLGLAQDALDINDFEAGSGATGIPCLQFGLDGLWFSVTDGENFLCVCRGGEWHEVHTLAGLGEVLSENPA